MSASIAERIAPQLPYLRRIARALTGSQDRGDACVVAMLEAIVRNPRIFDTTLSARIASYKLLLQIWTSLAHSGKFDHAEARAETIADRRIERLTPLPRQAFLLGTLEGLDPGEIATILGRRKDEVIELIDAANREISEQLASRVLIIEDELLIAMDLEMLIAEAGHEIAGVAATREEAVALARQTAPMMVLADIHLADGSSGIDAVNDILREFNLPVIFVTAYPERLLTGQRAEPTFLVTKPFKPEILKAVIAQALFFDVKAGKGTSAAA